MVTFRQRLGVAHIMESFGTQVALCGMTEVKWDKFDEVPTRANTCSECVTEKLWRMAVER